jgi:hypothetical protein
MACIVLPRLARSFAVPSVVPGGAFRPPSRDRGKQSHRVAPVLVQAIIEMGTSRGSPPKWEPEATQPKWEPKAPLSQIGPYSTRGPKKGPNLTWRYGTRALPGNLSRYARRAGLYGRF